MRRLWRRGHGGWGLGEMGGKERVEGEEGVVERRRNGQGGEEETAGVFLPVAVGWVAFQMDGVGMEGRTG